MIKLKRKNISNYYNGYDDSEIYDEEKHRYEKVRIYHYIFEKPLGKYGKKLDILMIKNVNTNKANNIAYKEYKKLLAKI